MFPAGAAIWLRAPIALLALTAILAAGCGSKCKCGVSYDAGNPGTAGSGGGGAPDAGGGASCQPLDDCGPGLGCAWGISGVGTCQPCGGAEQVCCGPVSFAGPNDTEFCNAGLICQGAVDVARRCSGNAPPSDAGGDSGG